MNKLKEWGWECRDEEEDDYIMTLRELLDEEGFDWDSGVIVLQTFVNKKGVTYSDGSRSYSQMDKSYYVDKDDEILDKEFDTGYGRAECPSFIAKDNRAIYFPNQYDGMTWVENIWLDLDKYVGKRGSALLTPYPGV